MFSRYACRRPAESIYALAAAKASRDITAGLRRGLTVSAGYLKLLLPGDAAAATAATWQSMLFRPEKAAGMAADLLKVSHHGSAAATRALKEIAAEAARPISISVTDGGVARITIKESSRVVAPPSQTERGRPDWMKGAPRVSAYRRELAAAIREQMDRGGDVYLGPTDAEIAADALDGFNDLDDE